FLQDKKGLYFLASTEGDKENINNFKIKVSELIGDSSFAEIDFKDWFSLFETLSKNINFLVKKKKDKLVICFDEFPYLISYNSAIPSIFQRIYDLILKNLNLMLILNGSSISMMEEEVLSEKSPLYGRRTGQWQLQPLSFVFFKNFFNYKIADLMNCWFVLGGIPEYLLHFDPSVTFWENVKNEILTKGRYLYEDVEILLRIEFREPKNYKLIFKAIALGKTRLGEICNFTGLDKAMVSKYLDTLKNLYLIKEEIPVTASLKFKRRLFILADPYFNFWFRYVYPNKIDLEAYRCKEVLKKIKKDFPYYSGVMFERLVEDLIREKKLLKKFSFIEIGRQWGRLPKGSKDQSQYEIDICALDEQTKEILFAECKWQEGVNIYNILNELKEKAKYVDWHNNERKEYYAIFAKSFKKKLIEFDGKKVYCFDLEDIGKVLGV
ncbi:ATP-binding protein, partial [archaeon]|nr:ATP-binding protein [archaeon]